MAIAVWLKIDEERIVQALQESAETLDRAAGEVFLDFSFVRRLDASALGAMEEFASMADNKGVKVVLRGVKVSVYRVLKLVKMTSRFVFVS